MNPADAAILNHFLQAQTSVCVFFLTVGKIESIE